MALTVGESDDFLAQVEGLGDEGVECVGAEVFGEGDFFVGLLEGEIEGVH